MNGIPGVAGFRQIFSRQRSLVESGLSPHDLAIHGQGLTGPNPNDIAGPNLVGRHYVRIITADSCGNRRLETCKGVSG